MRNLMGLVFLVGCGPGAIQTSEVDGLRGVQSAVWVEWDRDVPQGDHEVWHEFVLSSHGGLCRDLQEIVPALAETYDDFLRDVEDAGNDSGAICDAVEAFYEDAAELSEPLFPPDLTTLSLTLRDPDDEADDPPPEDTYDEGVDPSDPWFVGTLSQIESNPYVELADAGCDEADLEDAVDDVTTWYAVDGGEAEVEERGDEHYRILLDADLDDDDGDDAGEIMARGMYEHCVVEWDGYLDPWDW